MSPFTCVAGFAAHGEVDVTLLCGLLHQLHNQLVRLAHHRCAVDAYQFITGSQASILICSSVFDDVSDVDLKHRAGLIRTSVYVELLQLV